MKKKIKDKYVIIVLLGVTFLFLGLFYFIIDDDRELSSIERGIKEVSIFTEKIVYTPVRFITNKIAEFSEMKDLYKNLKKQNTKLEQYDLLKTTLEEKDKRIKELESLLELKNNLSEYDTINASVINRNVGYFYETLTIDKGKKDGIKKDMAVITNYGLVGKVLNVTNNTSTVKLLTTVNDNFQISVIIQTDDKAIYGLLSGFKDNQFIIQGISDNTEIKEFSKVTTTGLDNIFPSGILVGYVDRQEKDNFDLTKTVFVNPSNSFDNINYVTVLKGKI